MNLSTASGRQTWWNYLEPQWQQGFNEAILNKRGMPTEAPSDENLKLILESKVLRLAGPTAPYPNVSIEVTNCSGLEALKDLEILVITHAKLTDLKMMKNFPNLVSIFVNNNQITSLEGIEKLTKLQNLYFNVNQVKSIKEVEKLTNLETIYCNYNLVDSLEGINNKHTSKLKNLICLPNENLPDREIIRVENRLGIRCKQG